MVGLFGIQLYYSDYLIDNLAKIGVLILSARLKSSNNNDRQLDKFVQTSLVMFCKFMYGLTLY